jgi:hypothetical protein
VRPWLRRLLNLAGRWLAWRDRRNAAVDPPLAGWIDRDLPPAVAGIGPSKPSGFRCSCGSPAARDEVDICYTCRTRRERRSAEVEAYAEDGRRKRREVARKRARAKRGVLEMPRRARG